MLVGRRNKKTGMSYLRMKATRVTCIFDSNSERVSFLSNGYRWELGRRLKSVLPGERSGSPYPWGSGGHSTGFDAGQLTWHLRWREKEAYLERTHSRRTA